MSQTEAAQTLYSDEKIALIANNMRAHIVEMIHAAKSGHPGGSLSSADIVATLFFSGVMRYNENDPKDPERDRFFLCKGHAAPVLYAVLAEVGYIPEEELKTLRALGSRLQGHPDCHCTPGVEVCSGSLGQGLSVATGCALGFKLDGEKSTSKKVFALLGDGELQEGQNWEAAMFAAHNNLDNLIAIVDLNNLQIDGYVTDVCSLGDVNAKFAAFGWHVIDVDGHNVAALHSALKEAVAYKGAPSVIVAHTVKGKGVSFMEDLASWHGSAPNDEQVQAALEEIAARTEELLLAVKED